MFLTHVSYPFPSFLSDTLSTLYPLLFPTLRHSLSYSEILSTLLIFPTPSFLKKSSLSYSSLSISYIGPLNYLWRLGSPRLNRWRSQDLWRWGTRRRRRRHLEVGDPPPSNPQTFLSKLSFLLSSCTSLFVSFLSPYLLPSHLSFYLIFPSLFMFLPSSCPFSHPTYPPSQLFLSHFFLSCFPFPLLFTLLLSSCPFSPLLIFPLTYFFLSFFPFYSLSIYLSLYPTYLFHLSIFIPYFLPNSSFLLSHFP